MDRVAKTVLNGVTFQITVRPGFGGIRLKVTPTGRVNITVAPGIGHAQINEFVTSHTDWINNALARSRERRASRADFYNKLPLNTPLQRADALGRMRHLILPLVERYSNTMKLYPSAVRFAATTSRWGSCNVRTGVVCFSHYLLLLPPECAELTVVHELAHLKVANHGPDFKRVLDEHYPSWRAVAQRMKMRNLLDD